jgi:CheY-like chemotaxis protein
LDLNEIVESMLKMLQRLIGEDIELSWKPGLNLWSVKVDPAQVDQVLANLAVNARDALWGVGVVTIETGNIVCDESYAQRHVYVVPGEYVHLTVSDTGVGMDKETIEHLFEPFFTTKEVGKGTGLGLATIYGVVKQNSGFVNVYSEPGRGSSFKIYLPRAHAAAVVEPAGAEQKASHGFETILLVEDEEAILNLAATILKRHGYKVLTARAPGEALVLLELYGGPIHLIITDVVMPEMNGRMLMEKLQVLRPTAKALFMSGYTADAIARQGIIEEGVQFLEKPFSVLALVRKVREVLDQQSI